MANTIRVMIERGPKGKNVVACAIDWPGWSRGAKTEDSVRESLESYRSRYRPVAKLAGLEPEFDAATTLDIVERMEGTGSTDFWGISWRTSSFETAPMSEVELERKLTLLQACWAFFDGVAGRVSPEMRKGPRGGGRSRDQMISHTRVTEIDQMSVKLGLKTPFEQIRSEDGLREHREAYLGAFREYNAAGRTARSWSLPFLLRHTSYHLMDHAWEMEDKSLT